MSAPDRRAMLDRADKSLSVRRQCALLSVARSGVCRERKPAKDNDAALMRRLDELFTAWPFLGSRRKPTTATQCTRIAAATSIASYGQPSQATSQSMLG